MNGGHNRQKRRSCVWRSKGLRQRLKQTDGHARAIREADVQLTVRFDENAAQIHYRNVIVRDCGVVAGDTGVVAAAALISVAVVVAIVMLLAAPFFLIGVVP
jgi:hypothetical protein